MYQTFDHFGLFEKASVLLCNPDGSQLYALENIKNVNFKLRFNSISEISFEASKTVNGVTMAYYDLLTYRRYILVENIGLFMITGVQDDSNGYSDIKNITAQDASVELAYKHINSFSGTFQFYNYITPAPTLLGKILSYLPGWSVGTVDGALLSIYRTFDVTDQSIYNFLIQDCENAYQAGFEFDSLHRTISAHTVQGATSQTDIFISFENLIKSTKLTEITDSLITCLNVTGAGDLSINQVNSLGTNKIFNLSFFEKLEWMDQALIDALDAWEANIVIQQPIYSNLLAQLEQKNYDLIVAQANLATINDALAVSTDLMATDIQLGEDIHQVKVAVVTQQSEIKTQNSTIAALEAEIAVLTAQLKAINSLLSFENNFTSSQIESLSKFIIESSYNNTSFVQTDSMSILEIQAEAQDLYDLAQNVLEKVSQPMYSFELESTNFLFLQSFAPFIAQLELGSIVTLELSNGTVTYPIILEIDFSLDNPTSFKLTFGNRLRLDKSSFIYADLFSDSMKGGISANFNSIQYGNFQKNYKDDVSTFITSALDASKNAVINASNQNIIIDGAGIRGRYLDPATGDYRDEQFWMINNMLVFTDDNWSSAKIGLGSVQTSSGSAWGIVSEKIIESIVKNEKRRSL